MSYPPLKSLIGVRRMIVITRIGLCHLSIAAIERLRGIVAGMAVMMVRQVGSHIGLVMIEIDGLGPGII